MKKSLLPLKPILVLFVMLLSGAISAWSQSAKNAESTSTANNYSKLLLDYEVVTGANTLDFQKLELIDLDFYLPLRQETQDVSRYDENSGYTIIIYSTQKALLKREIQESETPNHKQ